MESLIAGLGVAAGAGWGVALGLGVALMVALRATPHVSPPRADGKVEPLRRDYGT